MTRALVLGSGVAGNPVLLQSRFGTQGNFELVAPASQGGGLLFWWRNNDDPALPWAGPFPFAQHAGTIDAITMIQSNFGSPGNLELIARAGDQLVFFSNYDGSWESYLEDFITKAHKGQTAAWSNGRGFPPTRYLINGGAEDDPPASPPERH